MRMPALRIAGPAGRLGRQAMAGGLLVALATVAAAVAAGPAAAAPSSVAALALPAKQATGTHLTASTPGPRKVTWSVLPATATAPDKNRILFNYGVVKPGSTITDHVEIVNDSPQSAAFSIYGTDATGTSSTDALLLLEQGKKPTDIGSWVTFPGGASQLSTIINGKKGIIVTFNIKVPLLATPGDHTGGMVAAVAIPTKNRAGDNVVENYRIAVPLEMRVPGALHAGLQVQSISTGFSDPFNPFGTGSATISYSVANTGNVRLTGTQAMTVTGLFGQKVTVKPPKLPTILPGDSVRFTAVASGLFPFGPMTAHVVVTPGWPATSLPLNVQALVAEGSASLFAMPWSLVGLLVLLIAIGVGVWQLLRLRRREHQAEVESAADRARRDTERRLLGAKQATATADQETGSTTE